MIRNCHQLSFYLKVLILPVCHNTYCAHFDRLPHSQMCRLYWERPSIETVVGVGGDKPGLIGSRTNEGTCEGTSEGASERTSERMSERTSGLSQTLGPGWSHCSSCSSVALEGKWSWKNHQLMASQRRALANYRKPVETCGDGRSREQRQQGNKLNCKTEFCRLLKVKKNKNLNSNIKMSKL